MLRKSGKRGHPCPVPDLSVKTLSVSLSMMIAIGIFGI